MSTGTEPALTRVDPQRPPEVQIYEALRAAILRMEMAPGALVSESEIGQAVGASRTPVRAALARLREDGLIATRPSRGNYVTKLSARAIREAHFLRRAIERAVVERLCAEGLAPAAARALEENIAASRGEIARGNGAAFGRLDDAFHARLAEATGYARVGRVLAREKMLLDRLRVLSLGDAAHLHTLLADHEGVLAGIVAADAGGALAVLETHLARVLITLDALERRHVDFFERTQG